MNFPISIPWKEQYLTGTVQYPAAFNRDNKYPLIIICHGFVGNRVGVDRLFVKSANQLVFEQCVVLRFDYSGCGESSGEYGKSGLSDFIDQTISVIDFGLELDQINKDEVILLGHSLGGATAVLTSTRDDRVKKLILWSAVGQPLNDISTIIGHEELSRLTSGNSIDYLGYLFYQEFFDSLGNYNPLKESESFSGDVLLIHGSSDPEIPVEYCHQYEEGFQKRKVGSCHKTIIDHANHTFSNAQHFDELIHATRYWLSSQFSKQFA